MIYDDTDELHAVVLIVHWVHHLYRSSSGEETQERRLSIYETGGSE